MPYASPNEFQKVFEQHLRKMLFRLSASTAPPKPAIGQATTTADEMTINWPTDRSPFPGLRPFRTGDSDIFFGRGKETGDLVKRMQSSDSAFLAVVGASGSGKSSLVGAGLIPKLESDMIEGCKGWRLPQYHAEVETWWGMRFTPGEASDPFWAITNKLAPMLERHSREIAETLTESPNSIIGYINEALADFDVDAKLLVFIDQFEELFTLVKEKETREQFTRLLSAMVDSGRAQVIVTMRSDFSDRCAEFPALNALMQANKESTFWLSRPRRGALYEMISRPAKVTGLHFEQGLDWQILEDTGDEPGALALVAYTLHQLWTHRTDDGLLTWETYNSFGSEEQSGVEGAIGAQAQRAYENLEMDEAIKSRALKRVFARLVSVTRLEDGSGYTATRKRAPLNEMRGDGTSAEAKLIDALSAWDARLLVTDWDVEQEEDLLEVAHEALLRSWRLLVEWINEAGEGLRLVDDVKRQTTRWLESGEDKGFLWTQEQMNPVLEGLEQNPELRGELGSSEWRFLTLEYLRLEAELQDDLSHKERVVIGDRLAVIDDPRPGVGLVTADLVPLHGSYLAPMLGGQQSSLPHHPEHDAVRLWGNEPEHVGLPDIVWLPMGGGQVDIEGTVFPVEPFQIGKYPITYGQYKAFTEAKDGFKNPQWWEDLSADEKHKSEPGEQNRPTDNHPAEKVSWYDAVAFCRWLSAKTGQEIRLPTEWEWQWAAQGSAEAREYAFEGEWDSAKTNTSESGLSRATAVGMYPSGAAHCGAMDMSGNVWEWCLNEDKQVNSTNEYGNETRVQRGGSWNDIGSYARSAGRRYVYPLNRNFNLGFRVAVCPLLVESLITES